MSNTPRGAAIALPSPPVTLRMAASDWLLLVALSLLWGGSFFFAKVAVAEIPPLSLVWTRVALAAVALLLLLQVIGVPLPRDPRLWLAFAAMGALNNVLPFGLLFWGQTQIASGLAAILNAATPLFTVIAAHWLTVDETLNRRRFGGVLLGLAGVAVIIGSDALAGLGANLMAQLACLGAALSYALAGIFGRRFRALPAPVVAAGQLTASSVLVLPMALLVEQPWRIGAPSMPVLAALAGLALFSTALGYVIYFRILARAGATNLLVVTFLIPVSAVLLGSIVLGEPFSARQLAGFVLIAAGLAAIDGRAIAAIRARWGRRPGRKV